jgi:hypothetical protein
MTIRSHKGWVKTLIPPMEYRTHDGGTIREMGQTKPKPTAWYLARHQLEER